MGTARDAQESDDAALPQEKRAAMVPQSFSAAQEAACLKWPGVEFCFAEKESS
jgi:hypothetical protein